MKMKTYFRLMLTSVLLGACAVGVTGCATTCTEIGCGDPVRISITAESWLTGDYTLSVTTPERAFTCSVPVAVLDSQGTTGAAGQTGSSGSQATCTQTAGPVAEQWEFPSIYFDLGFSIDLSWAASEVGLSLSYEGQKLLEERVSPSYSTLTPNGPDCAPACLSFQVTLDARSPTAA